MKVYRAGMEFELTKDEVFAAHCEWEYEVAYEMLYARIEAPYPDWGCSLGGPSLEEVVDEAVSIFLKSVECDCTREWSYDNAIEEISARYANEHTISSEE